MANRRCLSALTRHSPFLLSANANTSFSSKILTLLSISLSTPDSLPSISHHFPRQLHSFHCIPSHPFRHFSSTPKISRHKGKFEEEEEDDGDEEEDYADEEGEEEDDSDEEGEEEDSDEESEDVSVSNCIIGRANSTEDKEKEAAAIGYEVIGPLDPSEHPFKRWEPVFAIVQIGSHQFKVSNGDTIYTERLKHCEVNDKLILNRVLMLGSKTQTIIGRPILPDAAVHAVVEEHALNAKVIIFKKKRRKNYRRTKGHRQELTRLRITDIQGVEKPQQSPLAA